MLLLNISLILIGVIIRIRSSEAWFEYCDHVVDIPTTGIYIESPNYPNYYLPGSSCRYQIIAPLDTEIIAECKISFPMVNSQCGTEQMFISLDGDKALRGAEYLCGFGTTTRTSLFNKMTIAYTSSSTRYSGSFSCYLRYKQQPCDCGWSMGSKIVGGSEAKITEFPFIAALTKLGQIYCGAMIITHRYVLTAAHCFDVYIPKQIIVGEHDLRTNTETPFTQTHDVLTVRKHENYNAATNANDIGFVVTKTNIEWSMGVGPICLPFLFSYASFEGAWVDLAGWGSQSFAGPKSDVLLKTTVQIVNNQVCQRYYNDITPMKLCSYTYSKDSCQYDSGGPVVYRGQRLQLIGIIGYGKDCGNTPAVNLRITAYLDWIQRNTGANYCRKA